MKKFLGVHYLLLFWITVVVNVGCGISSPEGNEVADRLESRSSDDNTQFVGWVDSSSPAEVSVLFENYREVVLKIVSQSSMSDNGGVGLYMGGLEDPYIYAGSLWDGGKICFTRASSYFVKAKPDNGGTKCTWYTTHVNQLYFMSGDNRTLYVHLENLLPDTRYYIPLELSNGTKFRYEFATPRPYPVRYVPGFLNGIVAIDRYRDLFPDAGPVFYERSLLRAGVDMPYPVIDNRGEYRFYGSGSNLGKGVNFLLSTYVTSSVMEGHTAWWLNVVAKFQYNRGGSTIIFKKIFEKVPGVDYFVTDENGFPLVVKLKTGGIFIGNMVKSWSHHFLHQMFYYGVPVSAIAIERDEVIGAYLTDCKSIINAGNSLFCLEDDGSVLRVKYQASYDSYLLDSVELYSGVITGDVLWGDASGNDGVIVWLVSEGDEAFLKWSYASSVTQFIGVKRIDEPGNAPLFRVFDHYLYLLTDSTLREYRFDDDFSALNLKETVELPISFAGGKWLDMSGSRLVVASWYPYKVTEAFRKYWNYRLAPIYGYDGFNDHPIKITDATVGDFVERFYGNLTFYKLNVAVYNVDTTGEIDFVGIPGEGDSFFYPVGFYYPPGVTEDCSILFGDGYCSYTFPPMISERPLFKWLDDNHVMFPMEYFMELPDGFIDMLMSYFGRLYCLSGKMCDVGEKLYPIFPGNFMYEPLRFEEEVYPLVLGFE